MKSEKYASKSDAKSSKKGEDADPSLISDDMNPEDDAHLHEIKTRIIARDAAKLNRLAKKYEQDSSYDASRGACCCKFKNEKGAKWILILDAILPIFWVQFPRFCFAIWAIVDD